MTDVSDLIDVALLAQPDADAEEIASAVILAADTEDLADWFCLNRGDVLTAYIEREKF